MKLQLYNCSKQQVLYPRLYKLLILLYTFLTTCFLMIPVAVSWTLTDVLGALFDPSAGCVEAGRPLFSRACCKISELMFSVAAN